MEVVADVQERNEQEGAEQSLGECRHLTAVGCSRIEIKNVQSRSSRGMEK